MSNWDRFLDSFFNARVAAEYLPKIIEGFGLTGIVLPHAGQDFVGIFLGQGDTREQQDTGNEQVENTSEDKERPGDSQADRHHGFLGGEVGHGGGGALRIL